MDELMLRRREMVLPKEDNLLKFDDMTYGTTSADVPYFQVTTSKGNHFNVYFKRRSSSGNGYPYCSLHEINRTWSSAWPALGSYEIGDEIDMYLKNFTVLSNNTTGTDKTDATFRKLSDGSLAFGVGSADTAYTIPNTAGLVGDFHYNVVATGANSFNCFRLLGRNTTSQGMECRFEFDLELYINGTRLI